MVHSMHFIKTGCTSEISQISGFQNYFLKKYLTFKFLIQKAQFAMTDPLGFNAFIYYSGALLECFSSTRNFEEKLYLCTVGTVYVLIRQ